MNSYPRGTQPLGTVPHKLCSHGLKFPSLGNISGCVCVSYPWFVFFPGGIYQKLQNVVNKGHVPKFPISCPSFPSRGMYSSLAEV